MNDFDFIKNFSKINITKICKSEKINKSNMYSGRTKSKNYEKLRKRIEHEIANLYKGEK